MHISKYPEEMEWAMWIWGKSSRGGGISKVRGANTAHWQYHLMLPTWRLPQQEERGWVADTGAGQEQ